MVACRKFNGIVKVLQASEALPEMPKYHEGPSLDLTAEEIRHLKELAAAGEHGRIISAPAASNGLKRLLRARYVVGRVAGPDAVHYQITDRGRRTLIGTSVAPNRK